MAQVAHLVMCTSANNNKYYNMEEKGGEIHVEYGRVGVTSVSCVYPLSKWNSLYNSKIKKGYRDITAMKAVQTSNPSGFLDISDRAIATLIADLQAFAKKSVSQNYTVSSEAVTAQQVAEAQRILDSIAQQLSPSADGRAIDAMLLNLYHVIPRKMDHVHNFLIRGTNLTDTKLYKRAQELVSNEQATLDVMSGQVSLHTAQQTQQATPDDPITILDAIGISLTITAQEDIDIIKTQLGGMQNQYQTSYKVTNKKTEERFQKWLQSTKNKTTKLFWHGSRNENWWNILGSGLMIRPSGVVHTGSMLGNAIYGADRAKKSLGYTSINGSYWARGSARRAFMGLFLFHLGKQLKLTNFPSDAHRFSSKYLASKGGYDSVFASAEKGMLRNNEFTVYRPDQVTIRYLVEIK